MYLFISLVLTFLTRLHAWNSRGGLFRRDGTANIDDYLNSARLVAEGKFSELLSYRPTQLLYPALLSPIWKFHLSEDNYIFWTHMLLALTTTVFVYFLGIKILGKTWGRFAGLFFPILPFPFAWFNWATTETLYYALVMGHLLALFSALEKPRYLFLLLFSSLLLLVTKLDVLPLLTLSWCFVWLTYGGQWLGRLLAQRVLLISAFLASFALVLVIGNSPIIQAKLRQHFHVSVGLWVSTHTDTNANAVQHNRAIALEHEIYPYDCHKTFAPAFPNATACVRDYYSRIGLKFIAENPLTWMKMNVLRLSSHLFPGIYHSNWRWPFRLFHFAISVFIFFGALWSYLWAPLNIRPQVHRLFWLSCSTLAIPAIYEADAELRFRIMSQILWLMLAPMGWALLAARSRLLHVQKFARLPV